MRLAATNVRIRAAYIQRATPPLAVYASNQGLNLGTIAVGASVTGVMNFDGSAITAGQTLLCRSGIIYTGGSLTGSLTTTAP